MKKAWLELFDWEFVAATNAALCQAKAALHKPTSDGHGRARELWEGRHKHVMWLDEAVELCRHCHRLAPFCNFNGNTFAAIARHLTQELKLRPDEAHIVRSWVGHIVAGTATEVETDQFLQLSRTLTPDKLKKP
ncbi:MAG: hypothetical protein NTW03_00565 [Verrucomicrobia bacterium]|nr:hypothetical protein [Verrucomicrobiota bacterium]